MEYLNELHWLPITDHEPFCNGSRTRLNYRKQGDEAFFLMSKLKIARALRSDHGDGDLLSILVIHFPHLYRAAAFIQSCSGGGSNDQIRVGELALAPSPHSPCRRSVEVCYYTMHLINWTLLSAKEVVQCPVKVEVCALQNLHHFLVGYFHAHAHWSRHVRSEPSQLFLVRLESWSAR